MGLSEGGPGLGAGMAVISGNDTQRGGEAHVNRLMLSTNGGPASAEADGRVNYAVPVIAGLMYRDSVEVDELKYPIHVEALGLVTDSPGAGRRAVLWRTRPTNRVWPNRFAYDVDHFV